MKYISIYDDNGNPLPGINIENLRKLGEALYYDDIISKEIVDIVGFTMRKFGNDNLETCGTVGCAIGWAPFAGIKKIWNESWQDFYTRTLINRKNHPKNSMIWDWCFYDDWEYTDNSRQGAGQRILYMIERGIPEIFSKRDYESKGRWYNYSLYEKFTPCPKKRVTSPNPKICRTPATFPVE